MLQRGNNSYTIPSNKRYQPPLHAEDLEILSSTSALGREDKVEHELQPFLQRKRLHIDIWTPLKFPFFHSALRIAFCFGSGRLITALWIIPRLHKGGLTDWLVQTPPESFENNSINCWHISSVGLGGKRGSLLLVLKVVDNFTFLF